VFGFNTVRSTADDTLHEIWNGNSVSARVAAVDKDGKYYSGAATAGDLLYAVTGAVTSVRRFDSLAIGTQYQVLQVNAGATAPEWTSSIGVDGTPLSAVYTTTLDAEGTLNVDGAATFGDVVTVTGTTVGGAMKIKNNVDLLGWTTPAGGNLVRFRRASGSEGSETAISEGTGLCVLSCQGHDGTAYGDGADIRAIANQAWTGAAHGGRLDFFITPNNSTVLTQMLTIGSVFATGTPIIQIYAPITYGSTEVTQLIDNARKTGWSTATGTATRATFVTSTVTTEQLAERVKALIDDLHNIAGHGLIGT
jgi:hypothetical protein